MEKLFKESFLYRLYVYILSLLRSSFLFDYTKPQYKQRTYSDSLKGSFLYKLLNKIDMKMSIFYKKLNKVYRDSFIHVLVDKFNNSFHESIIYKGFIKLTGVKYFGFIFVLVIVFYIFTDYIIRKIPGLSSFANYWDEFYFLFMIFYLAMRRMNSNGSIKYNFTPFGFVLAIYFILGIIHVLVVQPNTKIAIEGFRAMFQHVLWYYIFAHFFTSEDIVKTVSKFISHGGFLLGLHAIYQFIFKVKMPGNWIDSSESIKVRAFSIVGSPNILGVIFVLILPLVISLFLIEKNKKLKAVYFIETMVMLLGLLLTYSRGAWIAFALAMLVFILFTNVRVLTPFVILGSLFIVSGNSLSTRLLYMLTPEYMFKSASGGRIYRWTIGLKVWSKHKFWGVGLGRYGGAVAINNDLSPFYLDNYYLKTLVETGYYGVCAIGFMIFGFLISTLKVVFTQKNLDNKILACGLFCGALGVLIQNSVENIFEFPAMIIYFVMYAALIMGLRNKGIDYESTSSN